MQVGRAWSKSKDDERWSNRGEQRQNETKILMGSKVVRKE